MRIFGCFLLIAVFALILPVACFSQSPAPLNASSSPTPRNDSVVSVQELAMSREVTRDFEKGTHLLLKGDAGASLHYFRKVIEGAPFYYRAYHNLALALYRLGQLDAAKDNFQKSIDVTNGSFAPSLFGLSMVFYQRAEFPQAESLIRRGLLVAPDSAIGKYCLGLVQFSLGYISEAEHSALEALRLDPRQADTLFLLARVHEQQHNPYAVITDAQAYLKRDPHGAFQADAVDLLHRAQKDISRPSASLN